MRNKEALRILFNNSHANLPSSKNIPQGGPASFAKAFSDNMNKHSDIELISLVFSHLPRFHQGLLYKIFRTLLAPIRLDSS